MTSAEMREELTLIQCDILRAVRQLTVDCGLPPVMREVLELVDLGSTSSLSYQYRKLEAKGYMRREPGRARAIDVRLPGEPPFQPSARKPGAQGGIRDEEPNAGNRGEVVWVPVAGRIAAGAPVLPGESPGVYLPLPKEMVGGGEGIFILEVTGDSMTGAGIFHGDWVVICPLFEAPSDGDIVAATINGVELEGTVKTYRKSGRQVWLMPHNPAYTPILGDRARFAGKVVALLRRV